MPISESDLLELIDAAISRRLNHSDPVGSSRRSFLEHIRAVVAEYGLPLPESKKIDVCSAPYVFQELNYDGYDWSLRTEELGHLSDMVEIDFTIWSNGASRSEASDAEYSRYLDFCYSAIKHKTAR